MRDNTSRLFVFATIRPKPEYFANAKAALDALIEPTLAEPGCHIFSAYANRDQTTLHLFECFEDEEALTLHYDQPHAKEVLASYDEWLAAPLEVVKLTATSENTVNQFFQAG